MEHKIWNPEKECMTKEDKQAEQLARLQETVEVCYNKVPLYKEKFDAIGLKPEHIKTLDDIRHIPYTTAEDLRKSYPFGMFAVPRKDVVRIHGTSGTTGKPKIVGWTKGDLDRWSELIARMVTMVGAGPDDIVQMAFGYGLFTGGFGLHYGLEKVGAMIVPLSSGNTERQIMIMKDFGSTILVSTPSYALYMADEMAKRGVDMRDMKLKLGLFGGEGHTAAMRQKLEERLGILATENYGLCECGGPGLSGECYIQNGMHIAEDHYITEVIDQYTQEPLNMGEKGELVVTTLQREAMPVLRYRTHDITWLDDTPCECGRTTMRMAKVQGRTDDMMVIRGVNVFPSQIEEVIMKAPEVAPFYEIIATTENHLDRLEVQVELKNADLLEDFKHLESLRQDIRHRLKQALGLDCKVTLMSTGSMRRFEGKSRHVTDLRDKD